MTKKFWYAAFILFVVALVLGACNNAEKTASTTPSSSSLVVYGDVVSETEGCVLDNRFTPGEKMVFRMNVIDPLTGEQVPDAKVQVKLSTGEVLDMHYIPHGKGENPPKFWTVAYPVPNDAKEGIIQYSVTATAGDRTGTFKPFDVAPSLLTIVKKEEGK